MLVIVAMEIAEMSVWQYTRAAAGEELQLEQISQPANHPITVILKRNTALNPEHEFFLTSTRWPAPDFIGNSARYNFAKSITGTQFYTGLARLGIPHVVIISK